MDSLALKPLMTSGSDVKQIEPGYWRLEIPAGPGGRYRVAQIDDYRGLSRQQFPWQAPFHLALHARVSANELPGTWGFGLWNDPFSFSLGLGGGTQRVPTLPNTAWFFYAAPPNYLSFRNDLPAQGFLAATFRSSRLPAPFLALGGLGLPLLFVPGLVSLFRRVIRTMIKQSAIQVNTDVTAWHKYELDWADKVRLSVDGQSLLETDVTPTGPLGLVLWIDNQFAALPPRGGLRYGFSPNPEPAWIEVNLNDNFGENALDKQATSPYN